MKLHRTDPPPSPLGAAVTIGTDDSGPVILTVEPRHVEDRDAFRLAWAHACARIWGEHWRAGLERAADLRKGTASKWMNRGEIPPPSLVAWVAYICARPDARAIGRFLDGLSETRNPDASFAEALSAFEGMNQ